MNIYDSSKMKNIFRARGFEFTDDIYESDLIILNTCNIREKASEKIYSELGKIKIYKDQRKEQGLDLVIVVAGCVAQAEGEVIFSRAPYVDIVVGPQSYQTLPDLLDELDSNGQRQINLSFVADKKFDYLEEEDFPQGISAFLTIQEGCDKFCKFCCVPYTRGAEYSRAVPEIYREAMNLAKQGTREITLLGQNVNGYRAAGIDNKMVGLGELIRLVATIPQIERIRYTTSHPNDVDEELIRAHAEEMKLMPFLHLPVQSGSDAILKAMNRKHTADKYLKIIDKFRNARSGMAFSSDFIVGYPGETDQDFKDTLRLVKEVEYAQCYSFKYSPRPGTPAASMENQVPEEVKSERLEELQLLLSSQQKKFNDSFVGKRMTILLDKPGRYKGQVIGKSEYMQSVHVDNAIGDIGKFIEVEIVKSLSNSLEGKKIENSLEAA